MITGAMASRTSWRSSILQAKFDPLGSDTVKVSPSSETMDEFMSSVPRDGMLASSSSQT